MGVGGWRDHRAELAVLSGVNRVTIARLETGAAKAKPETARKLARALKVSSEDLR